MVSCCPMDRGCSWFPGAASRCGQVAVLPCVVPGECLPGGSLCVVLHCCCTRCGFAGALRIDFLIYKKCYINKVCYIFYGYIFI